jgi:hypothetical protein
MTHITIEREKLEHMLEVLTDFADTTKYVNDRDDIGLRVCCHQMQYAQHSDACKTIKAITAIEQALAAPVQEPVGYWLIGTEVVDFGYSSYHNGSEWAAIYTTPPAAPEKAPITHPSA